METMKELYPNKWISIPLSILLTPLLYIFIVGYVYLVTLYMVIFPKKYGIHIANKIERHNDEKLIKAMEDKNE